MDANRPVDASNAAFAPGCFSDGAACVAHNMFQPKGQLVFLFGQRRFYSGIAMITEYLRSSPLWSLLRDRDHERLLS
jgi:hypothetical protein